MLQKLILSQQGIKIAMFHPDRPLEYFRIQICKNQLKMLKLTPINTDKPAIYFNMFEIFEA